MFSKFFPHRNMENGLIMVKFKLYLTNLKFFIINLQKNLKFLKTLLFFCSFYTFVSNIHCLLSYFIHIWCFCHTILKRNKIPFLPYISYSNGLIALSNSKLCKLFFFSSTKVISFIKFRGQVKNFFVRKTHHNNEVSS